METIVERIELLETKLALEELNTDFCQYLDYGPIEALVALFCEDAEYSHGSRISKGRQEIQDLFVNRASGKEVRTSRHMQTGLKVEISGPDRATGTSVCLTFAVDGVPPISPATPFLVADFIDEYQRCKDGRWRIRKRRIERIFMAPGNTGPIGLNQKS